MRGAGWGAAVALAVSCVAAGSLWVADGARRNATAWRAAADSASAALAAERRLLAEERAALRARLQERAALRARTRRLEEQVHETPEHDDGPVAPVLARTLRALGNEGGAAGPGGDGAGRLRPAALSDARPGLAAPAARPLDLRRRPRPARP